jgi:hypothetical protein
LLLPSPSLSDGEEVSDVLENREGVEEEEMVEVVGSMPLQTLHIEQK